MKHATIEETAAGTRSPTLVGLHIPKCAGSSLLRMAERGLPPTQLYQNTSFHKNFAQGRPEFFEIRNVAALRFIWGHFVHEEMLKYVEQPFLFTYLRDPEERLKSNYRFLSRHKANLGQSIDPWHVWVEKTPKNPICQFIVDRFPTFAGTGGLLDRAQNVLRVFDFVGFTENFAETAPHLLELSGVHAPVLRENTTAPSETPLVIPDGYLTLDQALYDWARDQANSELPRNRKQPNTALAAFLKTPAKEAFLRDWMAQKLAREYRDFNITDPAAQHHRGAQLWHKTILSHLGSVA
ncbi:sulfotransferase family protein [Celeribacter litoreus]|uniref:sulfotransferase family 2 domain-containing protein n=1 Tax=Celeribacter litoreus TaxID=2876714 RepID=UPI001CCEBC48|nr:sulfotransferase family 2 domain-containing protein [Celeribacter litoreus]MCA0045095.1 sulfotransferase family protein [Celeribacter litoreus]